MNELVELKERFEAIAQSTEPFPVYFDDAWRWIGYTRKDTAVDALKANFERGLDFDFGFIRDQNLIFLNNEENQDESLNSRFKPENQTNALPQKQGRGGARPEAGRKVIQYFLTVDCFKSFCMMAGTEKGKEVRKYFIKIEKAWRTPEMIAEQARRLGIMPQPAPAPIAWCPYPFFNQPDAAKLLHELIESCDKGLASREQFQLAVFSRPETTPYKTPEVSKNAAYNKAVIFLRGDTRKVHSDIAVFADASLLITGLKTDFVLVREVYERYSAQKENPISRPMFSRHLLLIYPEVGRKQKKINGSPELIFEGIKFSLTSNMEAQA